MDIAIFGSVFLMGFLGSWHCGVMCGPLSCNFRKKEQFFSYHLGRLVSYSILAGLLFLGNQFFVSIESRPVKLIVSGIFGLTFVYFGLTQLNVLAKKNIFYNFYKVQFKIISKIKNISEKFPIILGLLTGLFPCGWLYSFLMLSSQMKNGIQALGVILIFWLTSLPAFLVFTGFMQNLIKRSPLRYQTLSGLVLLVAGLLSVIGHWSDLMF